MTADIIFVVIQVSLNHSDITGEILVVDGGQWISKPAFVPGEIWERLNTKKLKTDTRSVKPPIALCCKVQQRQR